MCPADPTVVDSTAFSTLLRTIVCDTLTLSAGKTLGDAIKTGVVDDLVVTVKPHVSVMGAKRRVLVNHVV